MESYHGPDTLEAAIAAAALGGCAAAERLLGVSRGYFAHAADAGHPNHASVHRLIALDRECFARTGASPIADFFRWEVEALTPPPRSPLAHIEAVAASSGDVVADFARAVADGRVCSEERRAVMVAVRAAFGALRQLEMALKPETVAQ